MNTELETLKIKYDKLEARCKELQDDLLRLQDEVMFNEKYSLDDHDKVYNQIITGARQHYNKYNSRAGGQVVTIAGSFEYHVMAVAREYERNKLESENRRLKAQLEKARNLFSYEVDRNGCSDEIAAADTADEHERAVENYVVEHFDNALKELDSIE